MLFAKFKKDLSTKKKAGMKLLVDSQTSTVGVDK